MLKKQLPKKKPAAQNLPAQTAEALRAQKAPAQAVNAAPRRTSRAQSSRINQTIQIPPKKPVATPKNLAPPLDAANAARRIR